MSGNNTPVEKVVDSNLDEVSRNSSSEQNLESSSLDKTLMKEDKSSVKRKVDILLKATGDAPIIKSKKWAVECDRTVGSIIVFLKRYLKLDATESIYLYVNQCFAPSPDQLILNLYECFGSDGKLVLHYCKTPAWG